MSPYPTRLTVSDWEAEATRRRGPRTESPDAAVLDSLKHRFREISARIRDHRQASWIGRPESLPLRQLSDQTLELTRIAHHDVTHRDVESALVIPPETLDRLLTDIQSRLDEIDAQSNRIRAVLFIAELLRPVMDGLLETQTVSAVRLVPVLELILAPGSSLRAPLRVQRKNASDSARSETSPQLATELLSLVPLPGVSLEKIFESEGWPHPWFYASALTRAQWMAAVLGVWSETLAYPREMLAASTLLADCGAVRLVGKDSLAAKRPLAAGSLEDRRHPEVGAALIAGIENASPQWSILIGQHHERLDGTGFPRRLKDRELSPAARGLTTIVRWTELLSQATTAATVFDVVAGAAVALWRETLRGSFDTKFVTPLLAAIDPRLPAAVKDAVRQGTKLVLHPPQPLAGPHHKVAVEKTAAQTVTATRIIDPPQTTPAPKQLGQPVQPSRMAAAKRAQRRASPPRPARQGN